MLPRSVTPDAVVPHYLREPDHPWLRALLDAYQRFEGAPRRALDEHLQAPLPATVPRGRLALVRRVLDREWDARVAAAVAPARARQAVFEAAARQESPSRDRVLRQVARRLGVTPRQLEESLFADLPGERRLGPAPPGLDPGELALRVNLALAQGMLGRARSVRITLEGRARAILRQARLGGLLCEVRRGARPAALELQVSGPFALFRRTRLYARTLAALVPQLPWCARFALVADCEVDGAARAFHLRDGDPVFPSVEPARFDSQLEERFHREFLRLAPDWDAVREPDALEVGGRGGVLLLPDFALQHRRQRWRRWLLEIVGFWTPDYLERKLARLRQVYHRRLILCLSRDRCCADPALPVPPDAHVVWFRRRVAPRDVLQILESE